MAVGCFFINLANSTCSSTEFQCVKSGSCIPIKFKCDTFNDCTDKSDEAGCPSKCNHNHESKVY